MNRKAKSQSDVEWENRTLCSDGNCIGIIGNDGNCKECGKKYEGKLPWLENQNSPESGADEDNREETEVYGEADGILNGDEESNGQIDDDWENRKLCVDGNCIGVIGPDGRCKECGKPYKDN